MDSPQRFRTTVLSRTQPYREISEVGAHRHVPRVLVIDDNPDIMLLMQELLATRGYDVVAVPDAVQAEAEVHRQTPDLILSDVIMPGKSGYELCRELKDNPATRLIPFVLITGLTDREDRLKGIECGADDFLNKPIYAEELFARVKSLLKLKDFTDELETAESVLCTLGLSVESRDPYTEGHCERLAQNASALGLKQHPVTGENICRPLKSLRLVLPIIRNHHEHSDGSGYPDRLRKGEIPLLARILQVVDVYDALRTARPYKPVLSHEQSAITMREEARSGLWDERLVAEFFAMLEKQRQVA